MLWRATEHDVDKQIAAVLLILSYPGKGQVTADVQAREGGMHTLGLWCYQHQLQSAGPPESMLHLSVTEIQVRKKTNLPATFKWLCSYFQWIHPGFAMPTKPSVAPLCSSQNIFRLLRLTPLCEGHCACPSV